jgi:hypothetical protein
MQPRLVALLVTLVPIIASTVVFIISAREGNIDWCNPFIDGCTSISKAARNGSSIYVYRPIMMVYALLLIWFWIYTRQWLDFLFSRSRAGVIIMWLGITGALFLMVYLDFLGTEGEFNRFMRRYGIMHYFTLTALSQLILLRMHYRYNADNKNGRLLNTGVLRFQKILLLIALVFGVSSVVLDMAGMKTDEVENIVEWNMALLMTLYFIGMAILWKRFRYVLQWSGQ